MERKGPLMKERTVETAVASLQWFIFLLANSIVLPIVVGQVYHLSVDQIAELLQRTFLVVGISSLLSGWIGHRLPVADGPAGIWLGIFVLMGEMAAAGHSHPFQVLQLLEGGMLVAGGVLLVIGAMGLMNYMLELFTPLVTGVYLILLSLQLSGVFLKGMIGVGDSGGEIKAGHVLVSFIVFILVFILSVWGRGFFKSYAVLIGILLGWLTFIMLNGFEQKAPAVSSVVSFPKFFAWGWPKLDAGMAVSAVLVAFVLISNIIASVAAMQQVVDRQEERGRLNRAGIISGVNNLLSSLFSTVGVVPLSISAGFVRMTGQTRMKPYMIGCVLLIVSSFLPAVYQALSLLPGPIAYAAMLVTFTQMLGIGLNSILKSPLDERRLTIVGMSLSLGTAIMFLPQSVFQGLPAIVQYVASNGIMIGMLLALLLEHIWRPVRKQVSRLD
ncbi:purine/pyrimidine permease [Bacillus smithii]|uniref:purine/pyrimidine permease n=1 Tax=Bacillus smithii TaxID=1479 RepID=UPI002E23EF8F|nr:purine/pyrimidine permease [Bacillus smithii]MED1419623.1 purine/pyrimidine permease [Bacillus smithii]MED1455989.1 purine/pyrimidine permease [Bacillus smithii]MED1489408.1 purine/pyrimidine permease [Bacillus smithii]